MGRPVGKPCRSQLLLGKELRVHRGAARGSSHLYVSHWSPNILLWFMTSSEMIEFEHYQVRDFVLISPTFSGVNLREWWILFGFCWWIFWKITTTQSLCCGGPKNLAPNLFEYAGTDPTAGGTVLGIIRLKCLTFLASWVGSYLAKADGNIARNK